MPCSREDRRIERSAGVHEPQRLPWLPTQRTDSGSARPSRWRRDSSRRPRQQRLVARLAAALLRREPLEHHADPAALLRRAHAGRDEHDRPVAVAVRRHRAAPARAAADLDERLVVTPGRGRPAEPPSAVCRPCPHVTAARTVRTGEFHSWRIRRRPPRAASFFHPQLPGRVSPRSGARSAGRSRTRPQRSHAAFHRDTPPGPHLVHNFVHSLCTRRVDPWPRATYRLGNEAPGSTVRASARGRRAPGLTSPGGFVMRAARSPRPTLVRRPAVGCHRCCHNRWPCTAPPFASEEDPWLRATRAMRTA